MIFISIVLIFLSIVIICLGVFILKRCNKILSTVEWSLPQFMSHSLSDSLKTYEVRDPDLDLANEFFSIKEQLAPLSFLPLADIAGEIKRMRNDAAEEFDKTLKDWEHIERKEMEDFAETNPPDGKAFIPSDNLKYALKAWATQRYKENVIEEWTNLLKDVYLDLLHAKISIKEAEEKLKCANSLELSYRADVDPEVEEIINQWACNWEAEKWKDRLDFLKS